ncbi:MAG: hypothetical protein RLZZ360_235 [Candidatus Parcubacteria bacterium]
MRGIILSALGLALSAGFFIPFHFTHAAVLYEQSNIGTSYDLFADAGANGSGFVNIMPQATNTPPMFSGGGVAYVGTAAWLRVKRVSGLTCDAPFTVSLFATDGSTIGWSQVTPGYTVGPYCDFPLGGPNRTDRAVGMIAICVNNDCDGIPSFVLDGSPTNSGFVFDGTKTIVQPGGWAFQICDSGGCSGGFGEVEPCGDIVYPADYYYAGSPEDRTPIVDCDNPFNADTAVNFSFDLTINNQAVTNGATITKPTGTLSVPYSLTMTPDSFDYPLSIFRKEGQDYVLTHPQSGNFNLAGYVDLPAGDYVATLAFTEEPIPLGYKNPQHIIKQLASLIIPTAAAFYPDTQEVQAISFTVVDVVPQPQGASSVLFLPGIQASRLYLGDGNQVFNRVWEPTNNTDVGTLSLSDQGTSNVDIRTNDIIDETSIAVIGKNIYKGFISFLDDLAEKQVIKEWRPFAYDWRYDVFDIAENGTKYLDGSIQNPVDEAIRLASSSLSKKVTIVAHSNGGLLAKAIMYELEKRGKADLVDKVVFIGTPHLGTPKAIATILHGYDQEAVGGVVIDDGVARNIIKNLPGAYSLLPSEKYFDLTTDPLVQFDNSSSTLDYRTAYGQSIDSVAGFNAFITGQSDTTGRAQVSESEVNRPSVANQDMFLEAQKAHKDLLDAWTPPDQTKVYQIAGTGLKTIQAIEYREVLETVCPPGAVSLLLCQVNKLLKPHAVFTSYGDETVVSKSAAYVTDISDKNYFIDLQQIENRRIPLIGIKKTHENITEISQVQDFLRNVITTGSTSDVEFISRDEPNFTNVYDIEEINSPVQISATDNTGNVTGMVKEGNIWVRKEDIPDSAYIEFGGTKYLIIPASVQRTTKLIGEALGGYTLTLNTLSGNIQTKRHEIVNATTTPTMVATYSKDNGAFTTIKTDYTGDGVIDYVSTVDGVYVAPNYTYNDLKTAITVLPIKKSLRDVLLKIATEAEKLSLKSNQKLYDPLEKLTLRTLELTIRLYLQQRYISQLQADELIKIIKFLSK